MNKVYIFGPSCAGKSTLSLALHDELGNQWSYIDRDELAEQDPSRSDPEGDSVVEEKIQALQERVIIDAQFPWREKRTGELYFLVLPPLKILLERDAQRTQERQRSQRRAEGCKTFVMETYEILNAIEKEQFDHCFDSSKSSIQEEVHAITTYLN